MLKIFLHHAPPHQSFLMRAMKVGSHTVVNWHNFTRQVMLDWAAKNSQKIGGPGTVVEIDEANVD